MFHNILVCSDGSEGALYAVQVGAVLAKQFRSDVRLLDVFCPAFVETGGMEVWGMAVPASELEKLAELQHNTVMLRALPVFEAVGVSCEAIQKRGYPVGTIVDVARNEKADLIVIGSRGVSDLQSLLMGSVSSGVPHHAPCSVLVLHGEDIAPDNAWFDRPLLASDASEGANKATLAAIELTTKFRTSLTVLNVYEKPSFLGEANDVYADLNGEDCEHRVMKAIAQNTQQASEQSSLPCTLRQEKGHAAETILRVARENHSGLIVVGSRGRGGGCQAPLMGSVSNNVAHHAQCPVLVVR